MSTLRYAQETIRRFQAMVNTPSRTAGSDVSGVVSELDMAVDALRRQLTLDCGSVEEVIDITPDFPLSPKAEALLGVLFEVVNKHRGNLVLATGSTALAG